MEKDNQIDELIRKKKNNLMKKVIVGVAIVLLMLMIFFLSYGKMTATKTSSQTLEISIKNVEKIAKLEVVKAEVPYISSVEKDPKTGAYVAIKFFGDAVFTVDMNKAEFLTDQERRTVDVFLPSVEMRYSINNEKSDLLFFKNNLANDSYAEGTELFRRLHDSAYIGIQDKLLSSVYMQKASEMALQLVEGYIRRINNSVENLKVSVQFRN